MPDDIKNDRYFAEGFRELDESLSKATSTLADALPLDDDLRSLVPWQEGRTFPEIVPEGSESDGAQLLSICFELLNIVEERVAWKFRSARRASHGAPAIKGLWPSVINHFVEAGLTEDEVINSLRAELQTLWYTGEIFVQRPDIQEELRNALPYLSETFPQVVLRLDRSLELAWEDAGWDIENLRKENAYPKLRFSSWIGGDRDGHPFVTPEVTENTLLELQENALEMHQRHLEKTAKKLTLAPPFTKVPQRLTDAVAELAELLGENGQKIAFRYRKNSHRANTNAPKNTSPTSNSRMTLSSKQTLASPPTSGSSRSSDSPKSSASTSPRSTSGTTPNRTMLPPPNSSP